MMQFLIISYSPFSFLLNWSEDFHQYFPLKLLKYDILIYGNVNVSQPKVRKDLLNIS